MSWRDHGEEEEIYSYSMILHEVVKKTLCSHVNYYFTLSTDTREKETKRKRERERERET